MLPRVENNVIVERKGVRCWYPNGKEKQENARKLVYVKNEEGKIEGATYKFKGVTWEMSDSQVLEMWWNGRLFIRVANKESKRMEYVTLPGVDRGQIEGPWDADEWDKFVMGKMDCSVSDIGIVMKTVKRMKDRAEVWEEKGKFRGESERDMDTEMDDYSREVAVLLGEVVEERKRVAYVPGVGACVEVVDLTRDIDMADFEEVIGQGVDEMEGVEDYKVNSQEEEEMRRKVEVVECVEEFKRDEAIAEIEEAVNEYSRAISENPDIKEVREMIERREKRVREEGEKKGCGEGKRRTIKSVATGLLASVHATSMTRSLENKRKREEEEGEKKKEEEKKKRADEDKERVIEITVGMWQRINQMVEEMKRKIETLEKRVGRGERVVERVVPALPLVDRKPVYRTPNRPAGNTSDVPKELMEGNGGRGKGKGIDKREAKGGKKEGNCVEEAVEKTKEHRRRREDEAAEKAKGVIRIRVEEDQSGNVDVEEVLKEVGIEGSEIKSAVVDGVKGNVGVRVVLKDVNREDAVLEKAWSRVDSKKVAAVEKWAGIIIGGICTEWKDRMGELKGWIEERLGHKLMKEPRWLIHREKWLKEGIWGKSANAKAVVAIPTYQSIVVHVARAGIRAEILAKQVMRFVDSEGYKNAHEVESWIEVVRGDKPREQKGGVKVWMKEYADRKAMWCSKCQREGHEWYVCKNVERCECGKEGHTSRTHKFCFEGCKDRASVGVCRRHKLDRKIGSRWETKEFKCLRCGGGHSFKECPEKNRKAESRKEEGKAAEGGKEQIEQGKGKEGVDQSKEMKRAEEVVEVEDSQEERGGEENGLEDSDRVSEEEIVQDSQREHENDMDKKW